jgi:hypothetical protein
VGQNPRSSVALCHRKHDFASAREAEVLIIKDANHQLCAEEIEESVRKHRPETDGEGKTKYNGYFRFRPIWVRQTSACLLRSMGGSPGRSSEVPRYTFINTKCNQQCEMKSVTAGMRCNPSFRRFALRQD